MTSLIKTILVILTIGHLGLSQGETIEQRIRNRFVVSNVSMNSDIIYGGYVMYRKEMDNNLCKIKNGKFLMVDHEGGTVNRLKSKLPSANTYSKISKDNFYSWWTEDIMALKEKCFDMVLGPVIDIELGERSYSDDLSTNIEIADNISKIIIDQKMIPTYKHFPGDLYWCKSVSENKEAKICPQDIEEIKEMWQPFKNNNAPAIIISNYTYGEPNDLPAVMDKRYYDFLRNDLNFKGVILTDALWEMSIQLTPITVFEIFKNADLLMIMDPKEAEKFVLIIAEKIKKDSKELKNLEEKEERIFQMKKLLSQSK